MADNRTAQERRKESTWTAAAIDVARRWFNEVWNEGKAATITELMHPSAVGHTSIGDIKGTGLLVHCGGATLDPALAK